MINARVKEALENALAEEHQTYVTAVRQAVDAYWDRRYEITVEARIDSFNDAVFAAADKWDENTSALKAAMAG